MLTRYKLINIPKGGVFHIMPGRRRVNIVEEMTDDQADELISLGVGQYFLPINEHSNGEDQNNQHRGSAGDQPDAGPTADDSESGSFAASGSGEPVDTDGHDATGPAAGSEGNTAGADNPADESYVLGADGIWTEGQSAVSPGTSSKRKSSRTEKG